MTARLLKNKKPAAKALTADQGVAIQELVSEILRLVKAMTAAPKRKRAA